MAKEKTLEEQFRELPAAEQKRIAKKLLKYRLRHGTSVVCMKCGKPGGTLIKFTGNIYRHGEGRCG